MALVRILDRISRPCYTFRPFERSLKTSLTVLLSKRTFQVGEKAELSRVFREKDVETFAKLTGDVNPVHLDEKFAQNTRFGRRIVHGVLLNGLVSAVLGNVLPGHGCILISQQIRFPSPLFINDEVAASVRIIKFSHSIMTCETICTAVDRQEVVLSGEVKLLVQQTGQK